MSTTQYRIILKAFLDIKIPKAVKRYQSELISIDSTLGGYCKRALHGETIGTMQKIFTKDIKQKFSELINQNKEEDKIELIVYYKLATLVEEILLQYYSTGDDRL